MHASNLKNGQPNTEAVSHFIETCLDERLRQFVRGCDQYSARCTVFRILHVHVYHRHSIIDIDMQFITSPIRRIAQLVIQCHSGPLLIAHKCAVGSGLRAIRSRISFASTCGEVLAISFAMVSQRAVYDAHVSPATGRRR